MAIIFRWGPMETVGFTLMGYFDKCKMSDQILGMHLHVYLHTQGDERTMGLLPGEYHSWPAATISCNLWVSGYLAWSKEKFKNSFPSSEYNKIGLARWFGIPWITLFLPKSRASEIPHSTDIQSTFAELARPDLKLRVCHLPAAWTWGNNLMSQYPRLS